MTIHATLAGCNIYQCVPGVMTYAIFRSSWTFMIMVVHANSIAEGVACRWMRPLDDEKV